MGVPTVCWKILLPKTTTMNINVDINVHITEYILNYVKLIKRNKSIGDDAIANEYILSTVDGMMLLYIVLFNIIFDTGIVPSCWFNGNMVHIYKARLIQKSPRIIDQ
jgi:uncharacterized membrane protein